MTAKMLAKMFLKSRGIELAGSYTRNIHSPHRPETQIAIFRLNGYQLSIFKTTFLDVKSDEDSEFEIKIDVIFELSELSRFFVITFQWMTKFG